MADVVLDDFSEESIRLVPASKGKRFANYLIDLFILYVIVIVFGVLFYPMLDASGAISDGSGGGLITNLLSYLAYLVYYFILEASLGGKTIGKYITKTRTVDIDGTIPDGVTILKRSLSRFVPFDAFSFLGSQDTGWHDRWSHTMVIDEKESRL